MPKRYCKSILGSCIPSAWTEKSKANMEPRLGVWVPKVLNDYLTTLAWDCPLNQAHNKFLAVKDIFVIEDYIVFLEDQQSSFYWGYDLLSECEDPEVVVCSITEKKRGRKTAKSYAWYSEEVRLSNFLKAMLCWQIVMGGFEFVGSPEQSKGLRKRVKKDFPYLATGGGIEFFGVDGVVIGRESDDHFYFAARTSALFDELKKDFAEYDLQLIE